MIEAPMYLPMFRPQDTSSRHLAAMRGFAGTVVDAIGAGGAEGAEGHHRPAVQGELDMTPGWEAMAPLKTGPHS